jgi:hypothetical protein
LKAPRLDRVPFLLVRRCFLLAVGAWIVVSCGRAENSDIVVGFSATPVLRTSPAAVVSPTGRARTKRNSSSPTPDVTSVVTVVLSDSSTVSTAVESEKPAAGSDPSLPDPQSAIGTADTTPTTTTVVRGVMPAPVVGAVPRGQGQFVTSDSRDAKDYYALADPAWARIHPDHRVWFATVADLLRAYPGRSLHQFRTPTPSPNPP